MRTRNLGRRLPWIGLLLGISLGLCILSPAVSVPRVHADPPTSAAKKDVIRSTPPSVKAARKKPRPVPSPDELAKQLPECLKARYATLKAKIPALRTKHWKDEGAFWAEYAVEKDALVGEEALKTAGCAQ